MNRMKFLMLRWFYWIRICLFEFVFISEEMGQSSVNVLLWVGVPVFACVGEQKHWNRTDPMTSTTQRWTVVNWIEPVGCHRLRQRIVSTLFRSINSYDFHSKRFLSTSYYILVSVEKLNELIDWYEFSAVFYLYAHLSPGLLSAPVNGHLFAVLTLFRHKHCQVLNWWIHGQLR
jgi:hypothetical protein